MKQLFSAKKVFTSYSFGDEARWIHRGGAEKLSHTLFRGVFEMAHIPEHAVMLAMSEGYSEIYINGKLAARLSERSYIFDKSYEVFDVSSYLAAGRNVVAVASIETGEPVRTGFALEIRGTDTLFVSDGSWVCRKDTSVNTGADYYICGTEERITAEDIIQNFADIEFDDSEWESCEVIGNELLHAPYDRFHQSMTHEQTADIHAPEKLAALLSARTPAGYSMRLGPSHQGIACAMTTFVLDKESAFTFVTHGGIREISIDGRLIGQNRALTLSDGCHFMILTFSGTPDILIKTDSDIVFMSPLKDGFPFAAYLIPTAPVRYPWNEFRGKSPADDLADKIMASKSFDMLSEDIKTKLVGMNDTVPDSVLHEMILRDMLLPPDGYAEERIRNNMSLIPTDKDLGFENGEKLFTGADKTVIPPNREMLHFILDFGTEQVGQLELSLDAPAGTVVDIHAFEMITDNGIKYMGGFQTLRYVCREGAQWFRSRRRRGFRYLSVYVYGHDRDVVLDYIRVLETRYPTRSCDFACSDETLCRIYDMSVRTAEVCMLDLYVDCPGYEQNPWTGDARVTGLVNLLNFGAFEFDAQYLRLIAESIEDGVCRVYRTNNPRYKAGMYLPCACFPTFPEGCIPIWSFMWFLQVCDHYDYTGDKQLLSDVFYAIRETFARCEKMTNDRGLFDMQGAWNLIEWANNDLSFYGEVTANNVMLSYCLGKASEIAKALGETALSAHYCEMSHRYREAVNRFCWNEEKMAYVDTVRDEYAYKRYCEYMDSRGMEKISYDVFSSQIRISVQSNTMALLYDCVPEDRRESAARFLIDNIQTGYYVAGTPANRTFGSPSEGEAPGGYVHIGSPFFLFFALKTLYKLGYDSLALKSQHRDFGEFLQRGLTTCIENFVSGKDWTRSVAHAWSASPAVFLISEVLGVKPVKPGYREFTVAPKAGELDFAKGSVPTPFGLIQVEWRKTPDGSMEISCSAPPECRRV